MALKKFCRHRNCKELVDISVDYCEAHINDIQVARQQYNKQRPGWHNMYKTKRWGEARKRYLQRNPLCVECLKIGRVVSATVVDHITDHKGDYNLFWDESNFQSLCVKCHNSKTAKENNKVK